MSIPFTVDNLDIKIKEAADLIKDKTFPTQFGKYIELRRWLNDFSRDVSQTEQHRIDAYLSGSALKFAMNGQSGKIHRLAKRFEFNHIDIAEQRSDTRHYYVVNPLAAACKVN